MVRSVNGIGYGIRCYGLGGGGAANTIFAGSFNKKTIYDLKGKLWGKKVLVRVDFNVSDPKTGEIKSDARIRAAITTIQFLIDEGAKVILLSHNERPGELLKQAGMTREEVRRRLSLRGAANKLGELMGRQIIFVEDCIGRAVENNVATMRNGDVLQLDNTRFYPEDEKGDIIFATKIVEATGAEVFVSDGFSALHRDHASTVGVAKVIKARGGQVVAGYLLKKEIEYLGQKLIEKPERPYLAIIGGAKVADKIKVIENLLATVDGLAIGGAMLYPFLVAAGYKAGDDPLGREQDKVAKDVEIARRLLASPLGSKLCIFKRVVAANDQGETINVDFGHDLDAEIPAGFKIRDVSPLDVSQFLFIDNEPRTVVWNGPLGWFENPRFDAGTNYLVRYLTVLSDTGVAVITGGGDSEKAIRNAGKVLQLKPHLTHVSTGGGAMLEMLEGNVLPGIAVLDDRIKIK